MAKKVLNTVSKIIFILLIFLFIYGCIGYIITVVSYDLIVMPVMEADENMHIFQSPSVPEQLCIDVWIYRINLILNIVFALLAFSMIFIKKIRISLKYILIIVLYFIRGICVVFPIPVNIDKPIIYIYPEVETKVEVRLGKPEKLTCTYPKYENSWNVIAKPNGNLIDAKTGRNLYALYWEGKDNKILDMSEGFVIKGEDSIDFLEEKLEILGLTEREAEEFIIYWLPKLEKNKYNFIRFETIKEIEENMPLSIVPKPDSLIRVMMNFKGLSEAIEVEEQKLVTPSRNGYTVVEWGGTEF